MPLIQILSYSQKKEFDTPPVLDNDIRNEVFVLPDLLQRELENFESDANRTFFIALYGYFKLTRIFYEPGAIMTVINVYENPSKHFDLMIHQINIASDGFSAKVNGETRYFQKV